MLRHGVGRRQGQEVGNLLQSFIEPLEQWLDRQIDRRLVRTLFLALVAIVRLRNSRSGLLLGELGAHVLSPAKAPAGTKRLSNLLRSPSGLTLFWRSSCSGGQTRSLLIWRSGENWLWPSGTRTYWRSRKA